MGSAWPRRIFRLNLWCLALLQPLFLAPQVQAQSFVPQGPNASSGNLFTVQSGDLPPNGTVAGALGAVVASPTDAKTLYVSSPNGGIWKTTNGGASWAALTSTQASLSVASLALDPTDRSGQTLIAGTGLSSNGTVCGNSGVCFVAGSGNTPNGLLQTRDGGATWITLGGTTLTGQSVAAVAERGQVILAGTYELSGFTSSVQKTAGGLYRSTDGGATFNLVSGGSGLAAGPVSAIAGDPANPNRLYAAVTAPSTSGADLSSTAVYVSNDTGATWTRVFNAANSAGTISGTTQTAIRMAAGPSGTLAVGVFTSGVGAAGSGALTGLFYSNNSGASWTALPVPTLNNGNQASPNFAIAIDPNNPRFVYVSGDRIAASPFTATVFRVDAVGLTATDMSGAAFTADGSSVHADSRALAFDANGRLILVGDGGIYTRSQPQTTAGSWVGLNNLSVREIGSIGYDAVTKRIAVAAQDTGVAIQNAPNATQYAAVNGGDGTNVAINDRTLAGRSAVYTSSQNLGGLTRFVFDAQGNAVGPAGGANVQCNGIACTTAVAGNVFSAPFVLNRVDPSRIAMGGDQVYIAQDLTGGNGPTAASVNLALTGLTAFGGAIGKIAYGANDNVNAILAATVGGDLAFSTTATAGSFNVLPAYGTSGAGVPTSIVFDNRTQNRFYSADFNMVVGTTDRGNTFQNLTPNLPANFTRPTAIEFMSTNGVNALLIGGVNSVANAASTVVVADSNATGNLANWRFFGQGLPNVQVSQLVYNAQADVLAVGTFGRGAYALYDVTSNFPQATVLQFGLANNDSNPNAAVLTDGTSASRPLIKYGTGTLTIAGNTTYSGGTTINNGVLQLGNGGAGGSFVGNVAFCSDGANPLCNAATTKALTFNRSDIFTFAGAISGPGQVGQIGTGTTILTANSTYTGQTVITLGTLQVDGSITSQVTVNAGGRLTGTGRTGGTVVGNGAILAPGDPRAANPIGQLRDNGPLTLLPGAIMQLEIGRGSDNISVAGAASLAGTLSLFFDPVSLSNRYTLLTAAGGETGKFDSLQTNLAPFLTARLEYDNSEVDVLLTSNFAGMPGLNRNQKSVGIALDAAFNSNGGSLGGLLGLTTDQIPLTLTRLSGETATGSQQTTFEAMAQFLNTLLDPFIGGRGDNSTPPPARSSYAEDDVAADAYASDGRKRTKSEREAYAAVYRKSAMRNSVYDPHWSVWAAGFGGSQTTDGNGATGSSVSSSRVFGTAVGADYLLSPHTIAGFALAGGGTNFSVANGGSGHSDLFQAGVFIKHTAGAAYVSGALAYGWQDVTTDRNLTIAGVDQLRARFTANAYSGRLEGGYRFATPWMGITPYAAGQFTTFDLPAYAEGVVMGSNAFALAYGAKSVTDPRSELGVRTDRSFALQTAMLTLRGRLAWAHDFDPNRNIAATFQTLPGASFVVNGAAQAHDSALATASAEMKWMNRWSAAATFEGEFSDVTRSYAGKGVVRYTW